MSGRRKDFKRNNLFSMYHILPALAKNTRLVVMKFIIYLVIITIFMYMYSVCLIHAQE